MDDETRATLNKLERLRKRILKRSKKEIVLRGPEDKDMIVKGLECLEQSIRAFAAFEEEQ